MVNSVDAQAEELRSLMQRLFRRFGALASDSTPCGKPLTMAHAHALMVLLAKGELSQQELGRELCIDKSNVARVCASLVASGHLKQHTNEEDRRSRRVYLTAKGRRLAQEVSAASGARFGVLLDAVPIKARKQVLGALRHLVTALDSLSAPPVAERSKE